MTASSDLRPESPGMRRTGLVLSGLVSLFLLVDGGARLAGFAPYVEGLTKFGYSSTSSGEAARITARSRATSLPRQSPSLSM